MISFENILNSTLEEQKEIRIWRNKEDIRKYMFNNEIISEEEHLKWLESLKRAINKEVFYVIYNNVKIGIASIDKISEEIYEFGYYLNDLVPKGKGIGKKVFYYFYLFLFHNYKKLNEIRCEVLNNNLASLNLLFFLGMTKIEERQISINEQIFNSVSLSITREEWDMKRKVFIVAEISANHGHDINIVKETIKVAKECGADAVKIQTYTPDTLTLNCNNEYFQIKDGTIWDGKILYNLYKEAYTPWEWHKEIFDYAKELNICLFSTPFDKTAVDLLESLGNPIYKIASFEINDIPLIEYAASKKKPMIISTGVATEEEIKDVIETCKKVGNDDITLLQCTSQYPAKLEDANLVMIEDLAKRFSVKSGLSDHTIGYLVATTAVAMGAKVVEKHFILDKSIGGPDSSFSMLPSEFKEMVDNIRNVEKMIGKVSYEISEKKKASLKFKRSLFISKDIKKGEVITENNIKSVRPSNGISPKFYYEVLGKKVNRDLEFGTPLLFEYIEEESNG